MKIFVIIVTYNAEGYIEDCLGSLFKNLPENDLVEVLVVDNASVDKTIDFVKKNFPKANLLPLSENIGFAGGNNKGIEKAIKEGADYIYLLNQDTVCGENFLQEAAMVMQANESIAAIQSLLMLYPQKNLINSWGNEIHFLGFGFSGGYKKNIQEVDMDNIKEINYASGAAVLLRASVLKEIGFFNEDFFMYHEDLDLGWRIKLAGFKNVLAPRSVVYHKYEFSRSIKKYYYMERNRFWVLAQNYKIGTLLLILPALCVMNLGLLVSALFSGWFKEEVRAYVYYLKPGVWKKLWQQRKKIKKLRQINDREACRSFTGKIDFQEVANPIVKYILNPVFNLYWKVIKKIIW